MDIEQIFNSIEMFFWVIIGAAFFASGFYSRNRYRKLSFFLSIVFAAFGLSDGVEVHTGGMVATAVAASMEGRMPNHICNLPGVLPLERTSS